VGAGYVIQLRGAIGLMMTNTPVSNWTEAESVCGKWNMQLLSLSNLTSVDITDSLVQFMAQNLVDGAFVNDQMYIIMSDLIIIFETFLTAFNFTVFQTIL
jgi:hypothetical protein